MEPSNIQASPEAAPVSVAKPRARDLLKQSYTVLRSDKELMLFPVFSAICSVVAFLIIGAVYVGVRWGLLNGSESDALDYPFLFLFYLAGYYITIYFNAGLAACALLRFQGGDPTFSYGRTEADKHRRAILGYALLAATVGVILNMIAERFKFIGAIVARILGAVWSIATIFIAPVLVTTDLKPTDAVKESARIFKATWGNTVKGTLSFGLIGFLGFILCLVPLGLGAAVGSGAAVFVGLILTILAIMVLATVLSTCSAIYRTALFHYATTKQVPAGFSQNLQAAVR